MAINRLVFISLLIAVACGCPANAEPRKYVYRDFGVPPYFDDRDSMAIVIDVEHSIVVSSYGELSDARFCTAYDDYYCVDSSIINIAVPVCGTEVRIDGWERDGVKYSVHDEQKSNILGADFYYSRIEYSYVKDKTRRGFVMYSKKMGVIGIFVGSDHPYEGSLYILQGAIGFGACSQEKSG